MLDDGTTFKVRADDLRGLALVPGAAVAPDVRARLEAWDAAARGAEIAYRLLAIRLRSRGELMDRLRRRGIPGESVDALLSDFTRRGLIDDKRFAEAWVRGRLALRPSGKARLRQELLRKGISREIIDHAIAATMSEHGENEFALALTLARARARRFQGLPRETAYRRLGGLLQRRGFPAGVIARVLGEVVDLHPDAVNPDPDR